MSYRSDYEVLPVADHLQERSAKEFAGGIGSQILAGAGEVDRLALARQRQGTVAVATFVPGSFVIGMNCLLMELPTLPFRSRRQSR